MIMTETPKQTQETAVEMPESLAARLEHAAKHVESGKVTVGELFEELGRGSPYLLMALLAIPFAHPLPTYGLSLPFGLAIVMLAIGGLRNERTHKLPENIAGQKISPKAAGILRVSAHLSRFFERLMAPRWQWALWHPVVALVAIMISGLLLMLPLPIPFTNMTSGLSATLIALAMLYRDGLAMIIASLVFVGTLVFFGFLGWGAMKFIQVTVT